MKTRLSILPTATAFLLAAAIVAPLTFAQEAAAPASPAEPTEAEMEAAEKEFLEYVEQFGWEREGTGTLGDIATIQVPKGFRFSGAEGCQQLMAVYGNPPTEIEQGVIAPENLDWCVVFEYDAVGYVSDEDKDELDAAKILKDLQKGQERSNDFRKENGMEALYVTGWAIEPRYNQLTHNLEWGIIIEGEDGGQSVNFLTKLLGRGGVMSVTLVANPDDLQSVMPEYQNLLKGYQYLAGKTYAEYQEGDPVAKYALAGLITAGAGFAAMKTGLLGKLGMFFAKLGKAAWLIVVGLVVAVKKVLGRLFGGGRAPIEPSDNGQ